MRRSSLVRIVCGDVSNHKQTRLTTALGRERSIAPRRKADALASPGSARKGGRARPRVLLPLREKVPPEGADEG